MRTVFLYLFRVPKAKDYTSRSDRELLEDRKSVGLAAPEPRAIYRPEQELPRSGPSHFPLQVGTS